MKLKLALVALACLVSTPAHAQWKPTFEFYGMADLNIAVQNSGAGARVSLASGGFNGSRLGFKGKAPITETVAAVFLAESGLNFDSGLSGNGNAPNGINDAGVSSGGHLGTGPQFWSRQVYLGLTSPYGTITGGRQYTPNYIIAAALVLPWAGMFSNTGGLTTQVGLPTRVNNSLYYISPTVQGLRLQVGGFAGNENNTEGTVAASATTSTNAKAGRGGDGAVFFNKGGLNLNVGAWYLYNPSWVTGSETELAIKKGYQIGGSYNVMGYFTLYGEFTQGRISGGGYENVTKTLSKSAAWAASVKVPIGKANIAFNYASLNDQSLNNKDADQLGLQAWYNIQPQSHFYVAWAYLLNHRNSTYVAIDSASNLAQPTHPGAEVRALQVGFDQDF